MEVARGASGSVPPQLVSPSSRTVIAMGPTLERLILATSRREATLRVIHL